LEQGVVAITRLDGDVLFTNSMQMFCQLG
jgi:hypothetical protein